MAVLVKVGSRWINPDHIVAIEMEMTEGSVSYYTDTPPKWQSRIRMVGFEFVVMNDGQAAVELEKMKMAMEYH